MKRDHEQRGPAPGQRSVRPESLAIVMAVSKSAAASVLNASLPPELLSGFYFALALSCASVESSLCPPDALLAEIATK